MEPSGGLAFKSGDWIPAFAGMTSFGSIKQV
jgi:hypothetical protein